MNAISNLKSLYEIDNDRWLETTIKLLKEKRLDELDLDNLIEELESLTRRDKLAVESFLEQIIRHLLLLQYWTKEKDYSSNHWQAEILSFRTQTNEYLTTNLRKHLQDNLPKVYQKALKYVSKKTGNSIKFPEECPYNLEQLLDFSWLP
jgi:predicted unusual protein kinase regulating ubiquinone biosynthesis (AarF/ABC1/UbiB family)